MMTENDETGSIFADSFTPFSAGTNAYFGDDIVVKAKPPLKALDEHNAERVAAYELASAPRPNGIACPECGKELVDTDATVKSAPFLRVMPYVVTHCPACDYYGERVA